MTKRARVALVALALAAAACSSQGHARPRPTTSTTPTTEAPTTTTEAPTYPLTGLPMDDAGRASRPALVVKIENAPAARPQAGLGDADIVYEELVEGGLTRFLAVFQSRDADPVGPIRSVRPSDPDVVWPLSPLFAYAGGTKKFVDLLHSAPVVDVGVDNDPHAYYRRHTGQAYEHTLFSSTGALYRVGGSAGKVPPRLFVYATPDQPAAPAAGVTAVAHLTLVMGERTTADWDWEPNNGVWLRTTNGTPHTVDGGGQIAPRNVVIQFVDYRISPGDTDIVGSPVGVAQVVGTGDAWVLSAGNVVKGHWGKPGPEAVTTFTDDAGNTIPLAPGPTWVELAPIGAAVSTR